jgi:hypothetical protein
LELYSAAFNHSVWLPAMSFAANSCSTLLLLLVTVSSSPFCDFGPTASYDDLLGSAQAAFHGGDYQKSKQCYMTALHRYWKDYELKMAPEVERANQAQLTIAAARMRQQLSQLVGAATSGSPQSASRGDFDEDSLDPPGEPEQHSTGPHPVPPGAMPVAATTTGSALQGSEQRFAGRLDQPGGEVHGILDKGTQTRGHGAPRRVSKHDHPGALEPLSDAQLRHLSSLPRRQQIRLLQRMANEKLQQHNTQQTDKRRAQAGINMNKPSRLHSLTESPSSRSGAESSDEDSADKGGAGWV